MITTVSGFLVEGAPAGHLRSALALFGGDDHRALDMNHHWFVHVDGDAARAEVEEVARDLRLRVHSNFFIGMLWGGSEGGRGQLKSCVIVHSPAVTDSEAEEVYKTAPGNADVVRQSFASLREVGGSSPSLVLTTPHPDNLYRRRMDLRGQPITYSSLVYEYWQMEVRKLQLLILCGATGYWRKLEEPCYGNCRDEIPHNSSQIDHETGEIYGATGEWLRDLRDILNVSLVYVPFSYSGPWAEEDNVKRFYGAEIAFTYFNDIDLHLGEWT